MSRATTSTTFSDGLNRGSAAEHPPALSAGQQFVAAVLPAALISLPLLVISQYAGAPTLVSTSGWLQFALLAYTSIRLSMALVRGVPDLLIGVFWVFCYAAVVVPAMVQRASSQPPWRVPLSDADLQTAQFIALIGIITVDFTYRLASQRRGTASSPEVLSQVQVPVLLLTSLLYLPVLAALIQRRGGVSSLFVSRADTLKSAAISSGVDLGLITAGVRIVPTVILGAALLALRRGRGNRRTSWFIVLVYLPIVLAVVNPISTNRYTFIAAACFLTLCAFDLSRRMRQFLVIAAVMGALVLFPYLDYFRYRRAGTGATGLEALTTGDYDVLFTTAMAVRWVLENGITWGYQALGVVGFWVPRSVWTNKPFDSGVTVAEDLGMTFTNLSSPLWAEGYLNFGVVGVVLFAFGFGWVASRLARARLASNDDRGELIWCFTVGYQLILLRGSLLQAMGQIVAVIAIVLLITRRSSPGGSSEAGTVAGPHVRTESVAQSRSHRPGTVSPVRRSEEESPHESA